MVRDLIGEAIEIFGSQGKLADACGVKQSSIWQAKESGQVSAELALGIHCATKGKVPGNKLRPDIWRKPSHVPMPDSVAQISYPRRRTRRLGARR